MHVNRFITVQFKVDNKVMFTKYKRLLCCHCSVQIREWITPPLKLSMCVHVYVYDCAVRACVCACVCMIVQCVMCMHVCV